MTMKASITEATVFIVDDTEANLLLLERILKNAGFTDLVTISDPREVIPKLKERRPDIICLDLQMPHIDGFGVMELLDEEVGLEEYLPIIVLTADITPETKLRALGAGAKDFLTKPYDRDEATLRVKNLLETRLLHLQLQGMNDVLEQKVEERTSELLAARQEILDRLALAAEHRDDDTAHHNHRVGNSAGLLAEAMGLPAERVALIRQAAPLHDVGKIGISDTILLKPGKFTDEDFAQMKKHPLIGRDILKDANWDVLQLAEEISLSHHEKFDGSGYPLGLVGKEIPVEGQIVSLVDMFDALTHARPYKEAWPIEKAVSEIAGLAGRHFMPEVVEAFLKLKHEELV